VNQLDRLADLAGIEPVVRDFFGNERVVSAEAKRAILRSMGFEAETDASIAVSLRELQARRWLELIAPAIVVRPGDTAFACSAPEFDGEVLWRLTLESGEEFAGTVPWSACRRIDADRIDGRPYERKYVQLEIEPPLGYHRLLIEAAGARREAAFIVAPHRAYETPAVEDGLWLLAVQLYALRSDRNWGIGDFGDLAAFGRIARSLGASAVALNPLHALYLTNPSSASPYSASSRLFLNALYLDVRAVPDFAESDRAQSIAASRDHADALKGLRDLDLVDYPAVAEIKLEILHALWESFLRRHLAADTSRARAFSAFRLKGGQALIDFARYEAIAWTQAAGAQRHVPWQTWPVEFHDPRGPAVARFAREHPELVAESMYRQWLCETQLADARADAPEPIGLYLDLAVGIDAGGADAWAGGTAFARGVSLGAPPDELNTEGQAWGLAPFEPHALRAGGYAAFVEMLRSNMARGGALRMDHVMSLTRAYWIPPGLDATQGAYVRYPFDDLRGIVALESVRNRCLVVGEDLGTVPDGFRQVLSGTRILGCRLLVFERDGARFRAPEEYTVEAVASAATHDLPPLASWWEEADDVTRRALSAALAQAGLPIGDDPRPAELAAAVHAFLAQTSSRLAAVQLEDVFTETQRTNVPGTVSEHPNWRVKRAIPLETMGTAPQMEGLKAIFAARDGRTSVRAAK
jgi:4-alpha-glucanotransferase